MTYEPDWLSPPGDTILQVIKHLKIKKTDFLNEIGLSKDKGEMLLQGSFPISHKIAGQLEDVTGVTSKFWIDRESKYRKNQDIFREEKLTWLARLPTSDLVKNGFIPKFLSKAEKVQACLEFFGVTNINEWDDTYYKKLSIVSFRTSSSFDTTPESVITWLRAAELQVKDIPAKTWDSDKLRSCLAQIRSLTREKNPKIFLPILRDILSNCGVKLAIVPNISGTRASGATYFLSPDKAILVLSFRYKKDDHFWFSLFHEIGHLLLHGNKALFIEDPSLSESAEEKEANDFAETVLVPQEYRAELLSFHANDFRKIMRFSKKLGISPGIVVGQLQYHGNIPHGYLNKLKVTYGKDAFSIL